MDIKDYNSQLSREKMQMDKSLRRAQKSYEENLDNLKKTHKYSMDRVTQNNQEDLENLNRSHAKIIDSLNESQRTKLVEKSYEYNEALDREKEKHTYQQNQLRNQSKDDLNKIKNEYGRNLKEVEFVKGADVNKKILAQDLAMLRQQKDFNRQEESARLSRNAAREDQSRLHSIRVETLQNDHLNKQHETKVGYQEKLEDKIGYYENILIEKDAELTDLDFSYRLKLQSQESKYKKDLEELAALSKMQNKIESSEFEKKLKTKDREMAKKAASLKNTYEERIRDQQKSYREQLNEIRTSFNQKIAANQKAHTEELVSIRQTNKQNIEQYKDRLEQAKEQHEVQVKLLRDSYEKQLKTNKS